MMMRDDDGQTTDRQTTYRRQYSSIDDDCPTVSTTTTIALNDDDPSGFRTTTTKLDQTPDGSWTTNDDGRTTTTTTTTTMMMMMLRTTSTMQMLGCLRLMKMDELPKQCLKIFARSSGWPRRRREAIDFSIRFNSVCFCVIFMRGNRSAGFLGICRRSIIIHEGVTGRLVGLSHSCIEG